MKARENPFATVHLERLAFRFPSGKSAEAVLQQLEAQAWRGAIVGMNGTGKTTVLGQLVPLLAKRGFRPKLIRIQLENTLAEKQAIIAQIAAMHAPDFVLLDGAEQLTTRQWLSINATAAKCAGLVITQHRTGRIPTVLECQGSALLLDDLVAELSGGQLPEGEADRLIARYHGNVRECLRDLYDRWAG